ncbi:heparin lyase I family protein [Fibrobacterota bacterium]
MKRLPLVILFVFAVNLSLTHAELIYKADFEDGAVQPDIGRASIETQGTEISNEENPLRNGRNPSERAGYCYFPQSGRRCEYSSQRVETDEKTYVYKWQYYAPADYFDGTDVGWMLISQWKTWPCEVGGSNRDDICYGGGIFNEITVGQDPPRLSFNYRAEPDCNRVPTEFILGEWFEFQQEIYWTNTNNGYYKLWKNGELIADVSNVKTLFDNFDEGGCDIYWAVGVYSSWSGSKDFIGMYFDNVEIWDTSGVNGIIGEDRPTIILGEESPVLKQTWDKNYQLQFRPDLVWKEGVRHVMDVSGRRIGIPNPKEKTSFRLPAGVYLQPKNARVGHGKIVKEPEEQNKD